MSELYELPDGWEWKNIGETCENLDRLRKPISQKDRISGKYPYYGATKIVDYINDYIFDEQLVLIGEDGAKWDIGDETAFIATGKYWVNNHAHVIKPNREILDDSWLVYYLYVTDLSDYITGTTVPKLNQKKLKEILFPLPPLSEQQRIVSKLDLLFEKIDKSIALHQKNMDEADLFMGSVLNDVFGELEEKYGKTPITDVMKISNKTLVPNDNEEYNYVGLENIESNSGKLVEFSPTIGSEIKSNKVVFKNGMVLYGKLRPYLNKVWIANFDGIATTEILPFYPIDDSGLNMEYVKHYFLSPIYLNKVMNNCSGARMPRLTTTFIKSNEAYIPIPPLQIQQKVVKYLDEVSEKIEKIKSVQKEKMDSLVALKASILDKAFRGEL